MKCTFTFKKKNVNKSWSTHSWVSSDLFAAVYKLVLTCLLYIHVFWKKREWIVKYGFIVAAHHHLPFISLTSISEGTHAAVRYRRTHAAVHSRRTGCNALPKDTRCSALQKRAMTACVLTFLSRCSWPTPYISLLNHAVSHNYAGAHAHTNSLSGWQSNFDLISTYVCGETCTKCAPSPRHVYTQHIDIYWNVYISTEDRCSSNMCAWLYRHLIEAATHFLVFEGVVTL